MQDKAPTIWGLAVLASFGTFVTIPASGGSVAPDPLLGSITHVRLTVSPALDFEPIPGLDLTALEHEITTRCRKAVDRAGIRVSESADANLLVDISHAWLGATRDRVALLTRAELYVPAEPLGVTDRALLLRRRVLRIWGEEYLELAEVGTAHHAILETLDLALEALVSDHRVAVANGGAGNSG